jgi:ribosome maturation factor RimP
MQEATVDTVDRIGDLVLPLVDAAEARLYDVELASGTLRITIDRPGGVPIGVIGRLTREISHLLDEEDPIAGRYTLEVSSPGLERNLRRPDHFIGAVGSVVAVKTRPNTGGDRRITGELLAADDTAATIAMRDAPPDAEPRRVAYDDIERARTVFEWGPAPKPGGKSATPKSAKNPKKAGQP